MEAQLKQDNPSYAELRAQEMSNEDGANFSLEGMYDWQALINYSVDEISLAMDAISDKEKDLRQMVLVTKQLYERTLEL